MKRERLTPRQYEVLDFIDGFIETIGYPPTVREIGDAFGIASPNGVMGHLNALERRGAIDRDKTYSRGIRITDKFKEPRGVVVAGIIRDGKMIEY